MWDESSRINNVGWSVPEELSRRNYPSKIFRFERTVPGEKWFWSELSRTPDLSHGFKSYAFRTGTFCKPLL